MTEWVDDRTYVVKYATPLDPGIEIHGDGALIVRGSGGVETLRLDAPPPRERHGLDFGGCDCCERLPAGTVAEILALLPADHPAAVKLREAA